MGLIERRPIKSPHRRRLFVTKEISDLLDGHAKPFGFGPNAATTLVEKYLAGRPFRVGQKILPAKTKKSERPEIEKLENLDEVWAFCVRRPGNGWRLFGRFIDPDVCVLLRAHSRDDLGRNYQQIAARTIDDWHRILPNIEPLRARSLETYLSGAYDDED